ncbi:MAG: amino acid ABC transporter permease [Clostridia bacterium]|nr:amino acid ABC transporter permease [Clostridia bacterium]
MNIDWSSMVTQLLNGMWMTGGIFFLTLIFSLPLGLLVAKARMSKNFILKNVTRIYISIMRGTPLMLQLLVVYFGPYFLFKIPLSALDVTFVPDLDYSFSATIIAFSVNYAAYFAEIYRSGIESIEIGQYEASHVLGFSKTQTFFKIILPQTIKRILPSITNEVITLVKDTSLAFAISVVEMFTISKQLASMEASMIPYLMAGVFYYIFNALVAFVMERIEKHYSYYKI